MSGKRNLAAQFQVDRACSLNPITLENLCIFQVRKAVNRWWYLSHQKLEEKKNTPRYCKDITFEALKLSFMDCQHSCTSPLPWIWVMETLARSNQVDISLLLDLLDKMPERTDDLGRNARELVSLRILESFLVKGACGNPASSPSSQKIRLDPSDRCEDILRQVLAEMPPSHLKPAGPEMWKWDLQPFIEHKRSSFSKCALQQLKDAILRESHSFLASLKEQSGLPVGNQPEHVSPEDDGNLNGTTPAVEGSDTNDSNLLNRDFPDENLGRVDRKRRFTSEDSGEKSSKTQILSENGCENPLKSIKKNKHDIICLEQYLGGKLTSFGVDRQLANTSPASMQTNEGERCSLGRKNHVGSVELIGSSKDVNSERTSPKGLLCSDEVLSHEKQVRPCETELNNKSEEEQEQDNDIEEAKAEIESFCDLKTTNEAEDKFEPNIQRIFTNSDEVEDVDISSDSEANNGDRTDIARNNNASMSRQCAYSQDPLATSNWRDQILLADICKRTGRHGEEKRYHLRKKTRAGVIGQNGPPGDGNNECALSKGPVSHDEVLPHEKQAPHCGTEVPNGKTDGEQHQDHEAENAQGDKKGLHVLITTNEDTDKCEQNILRNVPNVGEAEEDVYVSSDSDVYHDERTNIDTKKKTFLSSQCTYSQDSLAITDWRELNLCVKCNKDGKLLVCSSISCPLVIHESCLGSDANFDSRGKFYCPFCAYSQAISKYMEIKKKTSLARKDLANFICLGTRKESTTQSHKSCRVKQNNLEQDDGLRKSNELNNRNVEKKSDNCLHRKELEYEQAGHSELHSDCHPPFGGKSVDSINAIACILNKDKEEGKLMRQVSQSPRGHRQHPMAAPTICKSHGENTSSQVPERNDGIKKRANIKSQKGVLCPPEADFPCEHKCSLSSEYADAEKICEEENESSGASKYFIRVRKQETQHSYPAIPQLRRKRLPWTRTEEEKLKEGMQIYCSPYDKVIPWKKILEHGAGAFQQSRSTMDLKDKWRNMCKASPKS